MSLKSLSNVDSIRTASLQPPTIELSNDGLVAQGINVDFQVSVGGQLVISGWLIGADSIERDADDGAFSAVDEVIFFTRTDLRIGYDLPDGILALGFLAVFPANIAPHRLRAATSPFVQFPVASAENVAAQTNDLMARLLYEHQDRAGFLLEHLSHSKTVVAAVASKFLPPAAGYKTAVGHIETANGITGVGGLVVGWTVCIPPAQLFLVADNGDATPLVNASRWNRPDIVDAYSNTFGSMSMNAGFLQGWHAKLEIGETVSIVVADGPNAYVIGTAQWTAAPVDPASFARWAFELPTPPSRFQSRLEHHDGPILQKLTERKIKSQRDIKPVISCYGAILLQKGVVGWDEQ